MTVVDVMGLITRYPRRGELVLMVVEHLDALLIFSYHDRFSNQSTRNRVDPPFQGNRTRTANAATVLFMWRAKLIRGDIVELDRGNGLSLVDLFRGGFWWAGKGE